MKTFKGKRTHDEFIELVEEKGWSVDRSKYESGSDYIKVEFSHDDVSGYFLIATFNGRFFGELSTGEKFTSDNDKHDGQPWFDELLSTVYVEKE